MSNTVSVIVKVTDQATSPLRGITGALGNMASVAGGIVAADVFGRMGEGLMAAGRAGFDFNRSIENATARLNAFTKDASISQGILEGLRLEAAKTPFAFEDMANAGTALLPVANQLNIDLMELVRTAEVLAASNPAEGLEGAAFALKEAASGDFTSIIERFNLSRSAINALKKEGVPNMEIVARAMADMGLDMDLVSNLATTFDGRMSTLLDTFTTLAGAFTEPIFLAISQGLGEAQTSLDAAMPALMETAKNWGQTAADSITTFKQAWAGEWEDSEVIQPVHRFVGNATLAIKEMWDKIAKVGEEALPALAEWWQQLEWDLNDLKKAWGPLNELANSTIRLFGELDRISQEISEHFGGVEREGGKVNKQFKDGVTLGEAFAKVLDAIVEVVNRMAGAVSRAADAWERLNNNMNGGTGKQISGGPPGPGDTPDTSPSQTQGWGDTPDTSPTSPMPPPGTVPIPPPGTNPTKAQVGAGNGAQVVQRGGDTIYITINYPMDWEEAAYQVSKIQQARRSES